MTVKAWLEGNRLDLAALADLLPTGDVRILHEESGGRRYYLTAPEIDNPPESLKCNSAAQRILDRLNGLARAHEPHYQPVALTGQCTDDQGNVTVFPGPAVLEIRATFSATAVVIGADGKKVPASPSPWPAYFALAATHADVTEALEIMGRTKALDWVALYKVHEIVRSAIKPDTIAGRGWADKAADSAFRASANRPDVSGMDARHARQPGTPPTRTMSLAEGRLFISDLVAKWLDSLAGN